MKNAHFYMLLLFLLCGRASSQTFSPNENYTYSRFFLDSVSAGSSNYGTAQSIQNVQYTDGLGRPKQNISINAIKSNQDIIASYFYEEGGKQTKQYMSISRNSQGGLLHAITETDINTYYNTSNAYSEVAYDDSPLSRIVKSASPGTEWSISSGHTKDFTYAFNEGQTVIKYTALLNTTTFENTLANEGFYTENTLHKNTVSDEDGNISTVYKNSFGKTVMTRVKNGSIYLDTYYVYNQYNQLAYIIPPLNAGENIFDETTRNKISYQYRYDALGRTTEKRIPGKGKEYYVYDKENRVIMSTDENLKAQGKWSFVKYDQLGRTLYTGICTGGERASEQNNADNASFVFENKSGTSPGFTNSGLDIYYTKRAYPTAIAEVISVNYYDEYPLGISVTIPSGIYSQPTLSSALTQNHSTKSLLTATLVKNVENSGWSKTLFWYDTKERLIGNHKINHLNGHTKTEMKLDFPGNITESKAHHSRASAATADVVVKQRYVYTPQNLLLRHYHQVDANPEELIEELAYDDLGRVTGKKVGNNLQTVDYTYNIRGWLTTVNDPENLGADLFGFAINFNRRDGVETPNNDFSHLQVKPKYNGSIAETSWAVTQGYVRRYGYVYDESGRMSAGFYQAAEAPYQKEHSEVLGYDNRGNIASLYRTAYKPLKGVVSVIDNLDYSNDGNRVTRINDLSGNANGYEGGNSLIEYDMNGNMIKMPDKGISNISYNFLNLPNAVTDQNQTVYLYSADGTKLRKTLTITHNGAQVPIVTEYLDGFQYSTPNSSLISNALSSPDNSGAESINTASEPEAFTPDDRAIPNPNPEIQIPQLVFFPTSEGFYDYENKRYIYQYKDHLGNVRISYAKSTTGSAEVLDRNTYYPFGMNHLDPMGGIAYYNPLSIPYNYKYNGKELQETGFYDYGWRQYMPDIGRWNGLDQLAEKFISTSPYAYVMNNPVSWFDPDGRNSNWWTTLWFASPSGTTTNWTNTGDGFQSDYSNNLGENGHVDYNGNFTYSAFIQNVVITVRGNSNTWNFGSNLAYNRAVMSSGVLAALGDWNIAQNRSNFHAMVGDNPINDLQSALDGVGYAPVFGDFADGINSGISLMRGDYAGAAGSAFAIIPIVGSPLKGVVKSIFQKHHIIPKQVYNKFKTDFDDMGFDINHIKNLKKLSVPFHGNHPAYSARVTDAINNLIKGGDFDLKNVIDLQRQLRYEINDVQKAGYVRMNHYYKELGYKN